MKLLKIFTTVIFSLSLSFSAFAVDKNFPNDKVTIWGDFSGVTLDVKLIGGAAYEPLYEAMLPVWEEMTGGKINILSKKSHFELDISGKRSIIKFDVSVFIDA